VTVKAFVRKVLPKSLADQLATKQEALLLRRVGRVECSVNSLRSDFGQADLDSAFRSPEIEEQWNQDASRIEQLGIITKTGGVNPGDRRALYYLTRYFQPTSLLEVGTHIGASTVHIAAALLETARQTSAAPGRMTSVDIVDVNDPVQKPWIAFGATSSPREMTERLGASEIVTYVAQPSLEFIKSTAQRFDFCFLDGDHAAKTVYVELAAAMRLLNPGGVILLHDYYPGMKLPWSDGRLLPGPWLAVQRLISEGAQFKVLPLGELPWPTKFNSNVTSLALVVRA
jgi:predicted O-methyltransferase YrrM